LTDRRTAKLFLFSKTFQQWRDKRRNKRPHRGEKASFSRLSDTPIAFIINQDPYYTIEMSAAWT